MLSIAVLDGLDQLLLLKPIELNGPVQLCNGLLLLNDDDLLLMLNLDVMSPTM